MTPLAAIAALLRERVGLDPETLGDSALAAAVRDRGDARGTADAAAYLNLLRHDAREWQALIEAVVVPETWFFRDREPFALLDRWAQATWRRGGEPITVLSLPCATGEEAWSIAIVLACAGVPARAIRVEAFDVSERALAVARTATYGRRSLRGGCPRAAWAEHLARRDDGGVAVAPTLRDRVHFSAGNLVDAARTLAGRQFDCVFSRNLLIYCDAAARAAALDTFAAIVRPDGLLVLGHAETLPIGTTTFVREGPPGAFAWRRVAASATSRSVGPASAPLVARSAPQRRPSKRRGVLRTPTGTDTGATEAPITQTARSLADAGRLDEAAAVAEHEVAVRADNAEAYALLGVIRAAQGRDDDAVECLRRALYLDPQHEEALVHLALILERRGDRPGATRLRDRARAGGASR